MQKQQLSLLMPFVNVVNTEKNRLKRKKEEEKKNIQTSRVSKRWKRNNFHSTAVWRDKWIFFLDSAWSICIIDDAATKNQIELVSSQIWYWSKNLYGNNAFFLRQMDSMRVVLFSPSPSLLPRYFSVSFKNWIIYSLFQWNHTCDSIG